MLCLFFTSWTMWSLLLSLRARSHATTITLITTPGTSLHVWTNWRPAQRAPAQFVIVRVLPWTTTRSGWVGSLRGACSSSVTASRLSKLSDFMLREWVLSLYNDSNFSATSRNDCNRWSEVDANRHVGSGLGQGEST